MIFCYLFTFSSCIHSFLHTCMHWFCICSFVFFFCFSIPYFFCLFACCFFIFLLSFFMHQTISNFWFAGPWRDWRGLKGSSASRGFGTGCDHNPTSSPPHHKRIVMSRETSWEFCPFRWKAEEFSTLIFWLPKIEWVCVIEVVEELRNPTGQPSHFSTSNLGMPKFKHLPPPPTHHPFGTWLCEQLVGGCRSGAYDPRMGVVGTRSVGKRGGTFHRRNPQKCKC